MGHSDPAESSKHSPQHDSAPWGEGLSYTHSNSIRGFSSQNDTLNPEKKNRVSYC